MSTLTRKIQLRRDTTANWTSANPVLSAGEIAYDTTAKTFKIGDGSTTWFLLPSFSRELTVSDDLEITSISIGREGFAGHIDLYDDVEDVTIEIDAIQGGIQVGGKITATGRVTAETMTLSAGALTLHSTGIIAGAATISATEVGYLDGVTSAIQTQITTISFPSLTYTAISTTSGSSIGETRTISGGQDDGTRLVWAIPSGASAAAWCYWIWKQERYFA